ncbi:LysR family transcriptional regulator [Streptomyces sp. SAJ15]|uniref:LysR family transcriptional regulator n=1 Tax=Streptomyces sp. SAJ15 TaxID=2011095 RepID=UPI001186B684|nr:LysR family transcriptional regulator [Streptomyces sp. SAJ15]TVL90335.1 LysR family transcriptional regulator [Streptomyces sp. SAJ15]
MQIDPRRLAVLRAVADSGGVLAAASILHLTPSAVSQHIARLEAETGVTLLDRSRLGGRRTVGLTAAGRLLAGHARRLTEVLADAERDLSALTGQVTGPVAVGAFVTALDNLVAPAAASLATTHPRIEVRIRQIEPEPGQSALRSGALDLLIVESDAADGPAEVSGARAVHLLDDPYRIAAPASWGPVADLQALLDRPWLSGPPGSVARRALDRVAAQHRTPLRRVHECLDFSATLAVVASGLAAAVVPALALARRDEGAFQLLDAPMLGARRLDLLHRPDRHEPSPAARLVIQAIRAVR